MLMECFLFQESGQPVITAELVGRYQELVRQHGAGFWWTLSLDEVSSHWSSAPGYSHLIGRQLVT